MRWLTVLLIAVLSLGLGGCPKKATKPDGAGTTTSQEGGTGTTTDGQVGAGEGLPGGAGIGAEGAAPAGVANVIYFDFDSSDIRPEFAALVTSHAKHLAGSGSTKVRLEGHTDERGSPSYNDQLSAARAQAVAEALHQRGLDYTIKTEGHGEREPFQADDRSKYSEEDLFAFDRRVEFKIVQ